jgi:hypothetical protein
MSMRAHVRQCAQLATEVANMHWCIGQDGRQKVARLRELVRRTYKMPSGTKDRLEFALVPIRIYVLLG